MELDGTEEFGESQTDKEGLDSSDLNKYYIDAIPKFISLEEEIAAQLRLVGNPKFDIEVFIVLIEFLGKTADSNNDTAQYLYISW